MSKLEPPEGGTFLDGLEVRVAFGDVWKQSLSELSGGQRSLLALSLILALLLFKPAPIYILDEVHLDFPFPWIIALPLHFQYVTTKFVLTVILKCSQSHDLVEFDDIREVMTLFLSGWCSSWSKPHTEHRKNDKISFPTFTGHNFTDFSDCVVTMIQKALVIYLYLKHYCCLIWFLLQFIVVSLKEGMFSNADVLFRTKFVDGVSTVQRTVTKQS